MELQKIYVLSFSFFCSLLFFMFFSKLMKKDTKKNLAPSPPEWPIIGHLHIIKSPLHRFLQDLSHTYGPIFSLKFGSVGVVVISSPMLLEECFSKNDIIFANRPKFILGKYFGYNNTAVGFAPYGNLWRNLRRALTLNMMSTTRLTTYYTVRKEEKDKLVRNIYNESSSTLSYTKVEMRSKLTALSFNGVMRMATGKLYLGAGVKNEEEAKRFLENNIDSVEMAKVNGANNFFKFLQLIDFQGYEKKLKTVHRKHNMFLQNLVDEIRSQIKEEDCKTLVDEMLALQRSDPETYTDDIIKGQISQVLHAGTDSTSGTIEWAIALLLNHPDVLNKVRAEIDSNIGYDELVDETNIHKVPYIQCIVNETLRLFPIVPILTPHMSSEDCIVGGFHIPRGTMLLANAWALHRDPNVWDDPTSFKPERFEGSVKIEPYQFAPFGMGRRQCPGMGLANRVIGVSVAVLIQCFDWKRISSELVDLSETSEGIVMPIKKAVEVMFKPRQEMIPVILNL